MPKDMPSVETSSPSNAESGKRTYLRPELRDLGPLAKLTGTVGGPPGGSDGATSYTTS